MYQKVLVPLDGSELAECSLSHVRNLVKEGSAGEVILLNIVKIDSPFGDGGNKSIINEWAKRKEKAEDDSKKYLAAVAASLGSESIKVRTESIEDVWPARSIADYAKKNKIDMIILTTHGYTGLRKMMFGSVAMEILHDSHVPVLLIRPESCRL